MSTNRGSPRAHAHLRFWPTPHFMHIHTETHVSRRKTFATWEIRTTSPNLLSIRECFQDIKRALHAAPRDKNVWQEGGWSRHQRQSPCIQPLLSSRYLLFQVQILFSSLAPKSSRTRQAPSTMTRGRTDGHLETNGMEWLIATLWERQHLLGPS